MKTKLNIFIATVSISASGLAFGGSATWNLDPSNGDWNTSSHWTPATVPNGQSDVATFGTSSVTAINVNAIVYLDSIVFNPDASAFTTNIAEGDLFLSGAGIINNSAEQQVFEMGTANWALGFYYYSTAGKNTLFTTDGGYEHGSLIQFSAFSTADHATIINQGRVSFYEN